VSPDAAPARLREMNEDDVADGLRLSRAAGWNQRAEDWRMLLARNPGRFVAAVSDGRVVGTGGAACYGTALGWVCMILVDAAVRGRGIGTRIMEAVLERLADVERLGLDATPEGRPVYAKLGFAESTRLLRMERTDLAADRGRSDLRSGPAALVTPSDLEAVLAMDREVFGAGRADVLRWAFEQAPAWCMKDGSGLLGYSFCRAGHHSWQIGPVVARDLEGAATLVGAALGAVGGDRVVLDAPAEESEWLAVLAGLGFREQRPLTRMYRGGGLPPGRPELQRAILGPEFG